MPTKALLDLNSKDLFEKHSISEIKALQLKVQNEIERKKEELRTMVGEKCRDLLNAADTITEMKTTVENFVSVISRAKQLCLNLEEKRTSQFPSSNVPAPKRFMTLEEISKIIEIKILLALPEKIWSALDCKDYLLGAQLFLFGKHLQLGLEVCSTSHIISHQYPIVKKQLEIMKNCKKKIVEESCRELALINVTCEKASECLCSLIFIELWTHEKLLNQYLDIRTASLNNVLKSEELSWKKLKQCVELIQQTILLVYLCFFDEPNKKCSIQVLLNSITEQKSNPFISKVIGISFLPEQYVSSLILNYCPKISSEIKALSQEYIKKVLCKWLEITEKCLCAELTKILLLIDDIKRLHQVIKMEVLKIEYPKNWDLITYSLLGLTEFNIYHRFIKSHVTCRIKELIQIMWQNSLTNIFVCLNEVDESILKDRSNFPEKDMRVFVWKESKLDIKENLKMKTLGYTPRVKELCVKMDSFLTQLLNDVVLYIGEDSTYKSKTDENSDATIILPFLNAYSLEMIERFTRQIVESCGENEISEPKIIVRARFLKSLTNQSPGVQKCLRLNAHFQEDFSESGSDSVWQKAINCLNEGSNKLWCFWRVLFSSKINGIVKSKLGLKISVGSLLKSKLASEIVTIEEQSEDGTSVKSDLRVPSQPSIFLQELLFLICQELNLVAPHTLPKHVHQDLVDSFVKDILERYGDWCKSEVIYQSLAWQMLLDVKFLTLLLITKENKALSEKIGETLEKTIDPFDLDVYFPHLQNSVKKSTQKLQGTFGVLVNISEKLPIFNGIKLSQTQSDSKLEEPNLLVTSSSVPWFPLLPVTNFEARKQESRFDEFDGYSHKEYLTDKINLKSKEKEKKESVTSEFFKSAGALFDAVTGGWT